jgi:hypothetical protein
MARHPKSYRAARRELAKKSYRLGRGNDKTPISLAMPSPPPQRQQTPPMLWRKPYKPSKTYPATNVPGSIRRRNARTAVGTGHRD